MQGQDAAVSVPDHTDRLPVVMRRRRSQRVVGASYAVPLASDHDQKCRSQK
jgi:hypothetical protein